MMTNAPDEENTPQILIRAEVVDGTRIPQAMALSERQLHLRRRCVVTACCAVSVIVIAVSMSLGIFLSDGTRETLSPSVSPTLTNWLGRIRPSLGIFYVLRL